MNFVDVKVIKQLKDAAENFCYRKDKNAVAHIFWIELYLLKQTLMTWFNRKIKSQNVELSNEVKNICKASNPIEWKRDLRSLCKFPLKIELLGPHVQNTKMSYVDYYIRYEHKFLRNIFSNKQLATSPEISTLENYCITYQKFLTFVLHFNQYL